MVLSQLDLLSYSRGQSERRRVETVRDRTPEYLHFAAQDWRMPKWGSLVWTGQRDAESLDRDGLAEYAAHPLFSAVNLPPAPEPHTEQRLRRYHAQIPRDIPCLVQAHPSVTAPRLRRAAGHGRDGGRVNPTFLSASHFSSEIWSPAERVFGDQMRALLLVFPPYLARAGIPPEAFAQRLETFFMTAPPQARCAIELREPEFLTLDYARVLARFGLSHIYSTAPGMPSFAEQARWVPTSPLVVVRLADPVGAQYPSDSRRRDAVAELLASANGRDAFIIVDDNAEGSVPETISRMLELVAQPGDVTALPTNAVLDAGDES